MIAGRGGDAAANCAGGCAARREAELGGARLWRRGKAAREGVSEHTGTSRCRRARGRVCRPAATHGDVDGAWPPRGGRALPRSGARRGATASRRAEVGQRGAGLGRGEARHAGCWLGRLRPRARSEAAAREGEKSFFQIYFQGIFKCHLSNIILSKKMTSFENVPKMKVAQNLILYNFAFRTTSKFFLDFEL